MTSLAIDRNNSVPAGARVLRDPDVPHPAGGHGDRRVQDHGELRGAAVRGDRVQQVLAVVQAA